MDRFVVAMFFLFVVYVLGFASGVLYKTSYRTPEEHDHE